MVSMLVRVFLVARGLHTYTSLGSFRFALLHRTLGRTVRGVRRVLKCWPHAASQGVDEPKHRPKFWEGPVQEAEAEADACGSNLHRKDRKESSHREVGLGARGLARKMFGEGQDVKGAKHRRTALSVDSQLQAVRCRQSAAEVVGGVRGPIGVIVGEEEDCRIKVAAVVYAAAMVDQVVLYSGNAVGNT